MISGGIEHIESKIWRRRKLVAFKEISNILSVCRGPSSYLITKRSLLLATH